MTRFFNLWVFGTLGLFYFGAIDWPGRNSWTAFLIVTSCILAFDLGVFTQSRFALGAPHSDPRFFRSRSFSFLVIIIFIINTDIYLRQITGNSLFDYGAYSFKFGEVYQNFSDTASELGGRDLGGKIFIIWKAIFFAFVFLFMVIKFGNNWIYVTLIAASMIGSSMLRGTDKEFIDLLIIMSTLYFLKANKRIKIRYPMIGLAIVLGFFLQRRIERYGGNLPVCLAGGDICMNYDSLVSSYFGPGGEILNVFLTNYVTQGYEALTIAFTLPFEWNYGIGHLPLLKQVLCGVTGISCGLSDFQSQLSLVGWDTSVKWTSMYTVIANDFGWYLLPLYFIGLGFLFGISERQWRFHRDHVSLAVMLLITIMMIYSSANMQISISFDWIITAMVLFTLQVFRIVSWLNAVRVARPGDGLQ